MSMLSQDSIRIHPETRAADLDAAIDDAPPDAPDFEPAPDDEDFEPTTDDEAEAAALFSESEQDRFEEWLSALPDHDFRDMTRAIDDIRRILRTAWAPVPFPVLAGWLGRGD